MHPDVTEEYCFYAMKAELPHETSGVSWEDGEKSAVPSTALLDLHCLHCLHLMTCCDLLWLIVTYCDLLHQDVEALLRMHRSRFLVEQSDAGCTTCSVCVAVSRAFLRTFRHSLGAWNFSVLQLTMCLENCLEFRIASWHHGTVSLHLQTFLSPPSLSLYILGADDTGLCGQFSRCFLAHDMGFMYRFCYGFFFTHDMGVMRRPNGQVFFHFIDRWHGNKWSNLHMTWDFQEDTDVQDGKWQVNSFKFP